MASRKGRDLDWIDEDGEGRIAWGAPDWQVELG